MAWPSRRAPRKRRQFVSATSTLTSISLSALARPSDHGLAPTIITPSPPPEARPRALEIGPIKKPAKSTVVKTRAKASGTNRAPSVRPMAVNSAANRPATATATTPRGAMKLMSRLSFQFNPDQSVESMTAMGRTKIIITKTKVMTRQLLTISTKISGVSVAVRMTKTPETKIMAIFSLKRCNSTIEANFVLAIVMPSAVTASKPVSAAMVLANTNMASIQASKMGALRYSGICPLRKAQAIP